ncbi:MAG: imidazole glycerol phosphate synthase subunit HisH [Ardenticatenaceae bacterium]
MADDKQVKAAIVDYGLGNLFSVKQACQHVGMQAHITSCKKDILSADVVILPGVGAYGDAMAALRKRDLICPLQDIAQSETLLVGICLGLQLLMTESGEFGTHLGLNIIDGVVMRFENPVDRFGITEGEPARKLKVPQIGWNRIYQTAASRPLENEENPKWSASPLAGLPDGEFMYFVHSYYVCPEDKDLILSTSQYGQIQFCSSLQRDNIFACQFHPERSGQRGLHIYRNIAALAENRG